MSDDFEHLGTSKQLEREAQLKMLTVTREGRKNMEKYFYSPLKKEKHEENKTKMFGESAENIRKKMMSSGNLSGRDSFGNALQGPR